MQNLRVADLHFLPEDKGRGAADPPGGMDRTILVVVGRVEVIVYVSVCELKHV